MTSSKSLEIIWIPSRNIQKKEAYQGKPPVIGALSQSHFSCFFPCGRLTLSACHVPTALPSHFSAGQGEKVRWKSSSVVGLHGLQGESLLHRGLLHGLRGHLCSGAWSTCSPFLSDLQGCFTMFSLLSHCCCATLFTNS